MRLYEIDGRYKAFEVAVSVPGIGNFRTLIHAESAADAQRAAEHCPARFDWSSVEVSLSGPFAGYRDDPRAGGEPPALGRRGSIAEGAVRSNSVVVSSPLLDQHLGLA